MDTILGKAAPAPAAIAPSDLRALRLMLALLIAVELPWGLYMLVAGGRIFSGTPDGLQIEKTAMEGAAKLMLVFGAWLVWRAPLRSRDILLLMIFLNGLWVLADTVYIPVFGLSEIDLYVKVIVNAIVAIGLVGDLLLVRRIGRTARVGQGERA